LAILAGVKVPEWARISGVSRQSATRWLDAGVLPVPARQLAAGMVVVDAPGQAAADVAICAWVSSCGQRGDLGRQVARLAGYPTAKGIALSTVVCRVGSGRNEHRVRVLSLLRDASAGTVVAGHRERLARFGAGYRVAAFAARRGKLIVAGQAEVSDGLVRDMAEVVTGLCAGLYARRPTRHRAVLAVAVAGGDRAA
jgi:putative resolvase